MEERVVEYALEKFYKRGNVATLDELNSISASALEKEVELYRSLFELDASAREHFRLHKTIRGYRGNYHLEEIILDLDKGRKTDEEVLEEARRHFVELGEVWGTYPNVWYSGTGYHFSLPDIFGFTPSETLPATVKETIAYHFPWADAIYDTARFIRAPWTINEKSKRYKIFLPHEDFNKMTAAEIIVLASQKPTLTDIDLPTAEYQHTEKIRIASARVHQRSSFAEEPVSSMVTCMQKAYHQGEEEGTRHERILRIATSWRKQGMPIGAALYAMRHYAPSMEPVEVERVVRSCYTNSYNYGCTDPIMSQFCDQRCVYFKNKNYGAGIVSAAEMERQFATFLTSDAFKNSIDLANIYSISPYHIFPGELVIVWGDTKMGKSAWVQNLVLSWKHKIVLYLSLENPQNLMYRRFVQIQHGLKKEQVYEHYRINTNTLSSGIEHINLMTTSPNLDEVAKLISESNSDVIVIDTLDGLITGGNDIEKTQRIAVTLKNIAQRMDRIILGVHHISKSALKDSFGNDKPLDIHSGKYSSAIEQKADKVLSIEGQHNSPYRLIRSLGARDEEPFELKAMFNKDTFRFTQIN